MTPTVAWRARSFSTSCILSPPVEPDPLETSVCARSRHALDDFRSRGSAPSPEVAWPPRAQAERGLHAPCAMREARRELGVWLVGALGDIATTAVVGAGAVARGL